ncbi:thiamine pyrophosphate-binding protein [Gulosibacter molinativorax]|uniref:2-succinyl-5-enolpyruvyl-6-hydroxy-3-cyclohexene-1-carboxylate synthase n=1 Tax=Gulosibacter molinativorax TaxID=256821 RepID=A0ABT7CAU4_9MICO|nr:thiamine pyrophosphate-binding protein [Gulosibacter molinativorax]MDJ1372322.1 2-succinyl-5-enolpyruvyl-6-hydroxy-3-cyclohexene-1-carboxylate synthase [Gulosibacter molinativorax]QUY63416.1 2-succinyl-5-enolpyruvyl-6-hydroxy-3-cyclohexene-1-carboxylate synthase [Gulosibacter molinativorax]
MSPAGPSSPALAAATELLVAAVNGGVRDIVVCPGSRSQSLALVAAELERIGAVRLHVRIDERSAAFFALGIARESGKPVPVITTSGTAVANLGPAMLEAHHAGVPLVALTADRPAELMNTGANQTTRQPGLFGDLVPHTSLSAPDGSEASLALARDAGAALADARVAWHLNVAFREPLSDAVPDLSERVTVRIGGEDASALIVSSDAAEAWPGDAGDRRIRAGMPGKGLPADLAEAIAKDLAAHAPRDRSLSSTEGAYRNAGEPFDTASPTQGSFDTASPTQGSPNRTESIDPGEWPNALVVAGDRAGRLGEHLAHKGGWPLIAEVSSGSRFGRNVIATYRDLLGENSPIPALRDAVELVIVVGHPTLSREVPALLKRESIRVIVVDQPGVPPYRPTSNVEAVDEVKVLAFGSTMFSNADEQYLLRKEAKRWLHDWTAADHQLLVERDSDPEAPNVAASRSQDFRERARFGREELAVSREKVTREMLADSIWRLTWPHDRLVVAASRLIRDLDSRVPGKRIHVHANRGLAGIDGTIASGLGIAHASQHGDDLAAHAGQTRVLIGDVAFLHDASSLLVGQAGEDAPRIQIVVGNDGGGTIFDSLEVAKTADRASFDRVQYTPTTANIQAIAEAYGWTYRRADTRGSLEEALTDGTAPRMVIEVPLDR